MKKILLAAKDMKIGGIEKSLIVLSNYLLEHGYTVTLVLEEKKGELLKNLNSNIQIVNYMPCSIKFMPLRKIINSIKRLDFAIKYMNEFDVSISYATYSRLSSYVARISSKRSILWCHADYLALFNGDKNKVEKFFSDIHFDRFSKIVFVSKSAKKSFLEVFPDQKNVYFCNNLIDAIEIYEKAKEKIELQYNKETITFLNVGRHDEKQKRLSRIINASEKLKMERYNFRVLFVGDGENFNEYKTLVKKYKLEDNVIFLGLKENPYPYFKIANCIILSSDYEGYPVVFLESYILNRPVITTKISDYEDINDGRGIVTEKSTKGIYNAMKSFLDKGYKIQKEFNVTKYNNNVGIKLDEILEKF